MIDHTIYSGYRNNFNSIKLAQIRLIVLLAMKNPTLTRTVHARVPTPAGEFQLYHYANDYDTKEHLALVMGDVRGSENLLVRVHSECFTGDVMHSLRCDCGEQLQKAMQMIAVAGRGAILYLRQEGRGIGLSQKLQAYNLQDQGYDTVTANLMLGHQADEREYGCAAAILRDLEIRSIHLLTNNPAKIEHLRELGVRINERVPLEAQATEHNKRYLTTKVQRMRHLLTLSATNGHMDSPLTDKFSGELAKQLQMIRQQANSYYTVTKQPFVTVSYAQSLDGSIAARSGQPLRLSSPESMRLTHALRASHDAILIGIGTVIADDPRLTVRLVEGRDPQPIVIDSQLRLPINARLLDHPKPLYVATTTTPNDPLRQHALEQRGVKVLQLPMDATGRVNLPALLQRLGEMGIKSVMVEGGAQTLTSFLTAQLAHYAVITIAPVFVGGLHAIDRQTNNSAAPLLPQLANPYHTSLGTDLIVCGELVWQSQPTAVAS